MMEELIASWVHSATHVAAERSAFEISAKGIAALEPSAHFVDVLHYGLLHLWLSPIPVPRAGIRSPLPASTRNRAVIPDLVARVQAAPVPAHNMNDNKRAFKYYHFMMEARKVVQTLVREQRLDVHAGDLFQNCVVHALEHLSLYEQAKDFPLTSMDGSGTFMSYWTQFCFMHIWTPHIHNPLNNEYIKDLGHLPFYAELYRRMKEVDPVRAGKMVASCSS
jgi:hypothetical protein